MDAGSASRVQLSIRPSETDCHSKKIDQISRVSVASKGIGSSFLFSFLLVLLISIRLGAQTPGSSRKLIHGNVTSEGKPVANASVDIRDLRGLQMGRGFTDSAGSFAISTAAEPGEYILFAAKESQIKDEQIALNQPSVVEITIVLPPAAEDVAPEPPQHTVSAAQLSVPNKAWKHLESAHTQFSKGNLSQATAEIERTLQADPACAAAFSMRAFIKLAGRDPQGAVEDAKHAIILDGRDAESFVALAMSYNATQEFQRAAEAARHALSLRPDSWQGRLELGKSLYRQEQFVPALRELDLVNIDFPDVHLVRGSVLMRLDRSPEAADEFEIFLREAQADPRSEQIRGIVSTVRKTFQGQRPQGKN
jgi:tetratricopeptide (TPR) repeat protein